MLKDRKVFQPIDIRLLNKDKLSMLPRSLSEPLKAEPENSSCQFMLVQRLWTKLLLTTLSGKFGFDTKNRFWSKNQRLSQKLGFIRCRKDCQRSCSSNGSKSNYFIPCRMWFHTFKRFHPWSCQRNRFKIVFALRTLQIDSKLHKPFWTRVYLWVAKSKFLLMNGVKLHLKCKPSNQRSILLILSTVSFSAIKSKHNSNVCIIYEILFSGIVEVLILNTLHLWLHIISGQL